MKIPEEIYKRLAEKNGISVEELKAEMQKAIDAAFVNPNPAAAAIPRKSAVPTVDEFLSFVLKQLDK